MQSLTWFAAFILAICLPASAQQRTVAITVDDLPYVSARALTMADAAAARKDNRKLLKELKKFKVPVTGFVNQKRAESLGANSGSDILRQWIKAGFDLGNHTYSHADANQLSVPEIEDEILRGETLISPLMKQAGRKVEFFRFPMNHTGDTQAKHDAISAFLAQRGYRLATCTIENSDYMFNAVYVRMLAANDEQGAERLRSDYLAYTGSEIDYFASLNRKVLGYEPPQVMLLHDNRLNADVIQKVLELFEKKGYKFVSLATAQSDPAYSIPDTYVTQYGPMWGYRWARERNVKFDGRLEPEPPQWIVDSASNAPSYRDSRKRRGK